MAISPSSLSGIESFASSHFQKLIMKNEKEGWEFRGVCKISPMGRAIPWGTGVCTYVDGSSYEGDFFNGKKDGQGTYISFNGNYWEGKWNEDVFISGDVKLSYSDGACYVGEWIYNKGRHGRGIHTLATGECLNGMWENDQFI